MRNIYVSICDCFFVSPEEHRALQYGRSILREQHRQMLRRRWNVEYSTVVVGKHNLTVSIFRILYSLNWCFYGIAVFPACG